MDIWEKIGFTVLGVVLTGIGYLIKRKIENKPHQEALERHKTVLDIHKQMNEQGLSVDDLDNLEQILTGKSNSIKQHTIPVDLSFANLVRLLSLPFLLQWPVGIYHTLQLIRSLCLYLPMCLNSDCCI